MLLKVALVMTPTVLEGIGDFSGGGDEDADGGGGKSDNGSSNGAMVSNYNDGLRF